MGIDFSTFKNLQNPLTIEMDFYPHWIKGHEKIRIKLLLLADFFAKTIFTFYNAVIDQMR